VFIVSVVVSVSLLVAVNSFTNAADALTEFSVDGLLAPTPEDAARVDFAFIRLEESAIKLDRWMSPVRVASTLFGWTPVIGEQLRGTVLLGDIALSTSTAVAEFRSAGTPLGEQLYRIRTKDGAGGVIDFLDSGIEIDRSAADRASSATRAAAESIQELGELSLFGPLDSAKIKAESEVRQAESLAAMIVALDELLGRTTNLVDDLGQLSDGIPISSIGRSEVKSLIPIVERIAGNSREIEQNVFEINSALDQIGTSAQLGEILQDVDEGVSAVRSISAGLVILLNFADEVTEALASADGPILQEHGASETLLKLLESNQADIELASSRMTSGISAISAGNLSAWTTTLFGKDLEILEGLDDLEIVAQVMSTVPTVFSYLLGIDEPKSILLLGQSSDELRASGGFTSSIWIIETANGGIVRNELIEAGKFDNLDSLSKRPPVPEPLARYMDAGAWYIRDIGWSPHFPAVAEMAVEIFENDGRKKPNVVIAINQWAYVKLAEVLEGLETAEGTLQSDDVLATIEARTDSSGTGALDSLWDVALKSISGDVVSDKPFELMMLLRDIVEAKDVMIWADDPSVQASLLDNEWGGALSSGLTSLMIIVDSNVGWNKTDRNIDRSVEFDVDLQDPAAATAKYTVSYENRSTGSNDCSYQSRPTPEQANYENLKNSCYWNYFRVYFPFGASEIDWDDLYLPPGTIPERGGVMQVGAVTTELEFDENGLFLGGLIAIPPGESSEFVASYTLAKNAVQVSGNQLSYSVDLWSQPGSLGRDTKMRIILPNGYVATSIPEGATYDQAAGLISYSTALTSDERLDFVASKP
jgi:hypothetical protein